MKWVPILGVGLGLGCALAPIFSGQPGTAPIQGRAKIRLLEFKFGEFDRLQELKPDQSQGRVDWPANRLIFTQKEVHLWVEGDPPGEANCFRIGGLLNPDIQLVVGARLTVTLLNLAYLRTVRFGITAAAPPFAAMPLAQPPPDHRLYRRHDNGMLSPMVARREANVIYNGVYRFEMGTAGVAWYINQVPGDANMGMYGKITVVP